MSGNTGFRDISECDPQHLRCHAYGHAWEDEALVREKILDKLEAEAKKSRKPKVRRAPMFGVRETVRCLRCGTSRSALFERVGWKRRTSYSYNYPEGYTGFGVVPRGVWRQELNRRAQARTRKQAQK